MSQSFTFFWQYPVITEKIFHDQNRHDENYIGFPWATAIDKKVSLDFIAMNMVPKINTRNFNYTCCQHIYFRRLIRLFKILGIQLLYTPHKVYGEDQIDGIIIKPCPLYAVNFEDEKRNTFFKNKDVLNHPRHLLYSFQGALQEGYLTDIRAKIFALPKKPDIEIIHIGGWHFNDIVYSSFQTEKLIENVTEKHTSDTDAYNKSICESTFCLCPSGSGPNSIRFWESLAIGTIPVLLSDELDLPAHPKWMKAIIRYPEKQIDTLDAHLRRLKEQHPDLLKNMAKTCIEIYNYFKNNYRNDEYDTELNERQIIHYCEDSFEVKVFSGNSAFDYQIKSRFEKRRFFKGPEQKDKLLPYIRSLRRKPVVMVEHLLASEIPNEFYSIVFIHDCEKERASQDKTLENDEMVSAEESMIQNRDPKMTKLVFTSESIQHLFEKHYAGQISGFQRDRVSQYSLVRDGITKVYEDKKKRMKIVVIGHFGKEKGEIHKYLSSKITDEFYIKQIQVMKKKHKHLEEYNTEKENEYLKSDLFLQISKYEGIQTSILDAAMLGIAIVGTPVGLLKEVPSDCYVKIDTEKIYDLEYMYEKMKYAWENRESLGNKVKNWIMNSRGRSKFEKELNALIDQQIKDE